MTWYGKPLSDRGNEDAWSLRALRNGLIRWYSPRSSANHSVSTAARVGNDSMVCQNLFRLLPSCGLLVNDGPTCTQPLFHQLAVVVPRELGNVRWLDDYRSRRLGIAELDLESRPDDPASFWERFVPRPQQGKVVIGLAG